MKNDIIGNGINIQMDILDLRTRIKNLTFILRKNMQKIFYMIIIKINYAKQK